MGQIAGATRTKDKVSKYGKGQLEPMAGGLRGLSPTIFLDKILLCQEDLLVKYGVP